MQKDMSQLATVQQRAARFSLGYHNYRTPGYVENILKRKPSGDKEEQLPLSLKNQYREH